MKLTPRDSDEGRSEYIAMVKRTALELRVRLIEMGIYSFTISEADDETA